MCGVALESGLVLASPMRVLRHWRQGCRPSPVGSAWIPHSPVPPWGPLRTPAEWAVQVVPLGDCLVRAPIHPQSSRPLGRAGSGTPLVVAWSSPPMHSHVCGRGAVDEPDGVGVNRPHTHGAHGDCQLGEAIQLDLSGPLIPCPSSLASAGRTPAVPSPGRHRAPPVGHSAGTQGCTEMLELERPSLGGAPMLPL